MNAMRGACMILAMKNLPTNRTADLARFTRLLAASLVLAFGVPVAAEAAGAYRPAAEVKAAFLKQLDRPRIALDPQTAKTESEGDRVVEHVRIASERKADGSVERVPLLLVRPAKAAGRLPVVIALHGTGGNKESLRGLLVEFARRGMIGVAIDARYHGERSGGARGSQAYAAAITRAWKTPPGEPQEHPFYFDTCWDIWRTIDYLEGRPDVDGGGWE